MDKKILVNSDNRATRVAILESGKLVELYIERPLEHRIVGNLYKGVVANVLPGMQAAFVDIGLEKNAFLYVDDVYTEDDEKPHPARTNIDKLLKVGEEIIVQVVKEPFGTKGARVTGQVTIPGRYLVLVPGADYIGVSRRIESQVEKERLKRRAAKIRPPEMGLIVRTVAEGAKEKALAQDLQFLMQLWRLVLNRFQQKTAPALLYQDLALTCRIARDLFVEDFNSFLVDNEHEYEKVCEILDCFSPQPRLKRKVSLYREEKPIFERYGVEKELEKALQRQVWLRSGGYLVFDEAEALTVIDVNTGRYIGRRNLADTILKTNLEAAEEIARQIRLRDIGGIIIIDFIDMTVENHRRKVLGKLKEAIKADRTKTYVLGLTSLGLVEMTRKKVRQDLAEVLQQHCPYCGGSGRVFTALAASTRIERELKKTLQKTPREAVLVEMHHEVASIIIGAGGGNLKKMEAELGKHIFIRGAEEMHIEHYRIVAAGSLKEIEKLALPVSMGEVLELLIEEPHSSSPENGIARLHGYVINVTGAGEAAGQLVRAEVTEVSRTFARATPIAAARKKKKRRPWGGLARRAKQG
ncbi:MAG TPA: Rne/Rng family ribonuclease [Firmicutes bacterium]|jgi:ribonuclease G|nr:Rne/Rng family ribonuclease [Bacillota bacterium]